MRNPFRLPVILAVLAISGATTGQSQQSISTAGSAVTENFNGIGTSSTATIPSAWRMGTDWSTGATATTVAAGTSGTGIVGTTGGFYNWADGVTGSSTDRALGFLTSSGYSSPRSLMYAFVSNTGLIVTSITVTWNYE